MPRHKDPIEAAYIAEQALREIASDLRNPTIARLEARGRADEALEILALDRLAKMEAALRSISSALHIRSKYRLAAMQAADQALEALVAAGVAGQQRRRDPEPARHRPTGRRWSTNPFTIQVPRDTAAV